MLAETDKTESKRIDAINEIIKFLERERDHFEQISGARADRTTRTS